MKDPRHYHKKIIVGRKSIDDVVAKIENIEIKSSSFSALIGNSWVENFLIDI